MARSVKNGWDFVKVGKTYQYKEDWLIAEVLILEDNSNDEYYEFLLKPLKSNVEEICKPFTVSALKEANGYYNGMSQFFEEEEYFLPNGYPYIFEE